MRMDTLLVGARLWSEGALVEGADAVAVAEGRIAAIGRSSDLEREVGPDTRTIDAAGCSVTPGLTDAHIHLVAWARSLRELCLEGVGTRAEALQRVAASRGRSPGDIVVGRGWASETWEAPPHRLSLDSVTGDVPALLKSKDDHAMWVNSAALARAGIGRATPDPAGGRIDRDGGGEPTGLLLEHAVRLVEGLVPRPTRDRDRQALRAAVAVLHAEGVTSVHDFEGQLEAELLHELATTDDRPLRVLMHVAHRDLDRALGDGVKSGAGDDRFRFGALKLFADGTLGSRTAAVIEPYDGTVDRGLELIPPKELSRLVGRAARGGLSTAIHAIGDRAVRSALDAFEESGHDLARLPISPRVEHAQLVHPEDFRRFAALGVTASMQPVHCTSDRPLVERYWRTRAGRAYAWRALLEGGARLAFGSDAPVEWPNPMHGIHAAVTRSSRAPAHDVDFTPEQRIGLDDALLAYTEGPARLANAWPRMGRLTTGSLADLVLWDADLHSLAPERLHEARPRVTFVGGGVVFERSVTATPAEGRAGGRW